MYDIVALGELLIDFTQVDKSESGMNLFEQNPGGAPANVLTAASHLGCITAFIGKVGSDMHGEFLSDTLIRESIDTKALIMDADYFTTLAFVGLSKDGEREFSFARKPGADIMLRVDELDRSMLGSCRIFHVGSLSLTDEPAKSATIEAIDIAKKAGALISYDPNYRASLWGSVEVAIKEMKSLMPFVDLVKISGEEIIMLTDESDVEKAAKCLIDQGIDLVAITLGSEGAYIRTKEDGIYTKGFCSNVIDTTGAGDAFWGGFLSEYLKYGKKINDLTLDDLCALGLYGNAVASLCVEKRGGIPAMPYLHDVIERLKRK